MTPRGEAAHTYTHAQIHKHTNIHTRVCNWHKTLTAAYLREGYVQCVDEPCLFYKITSTTYSISCVIVDDMVTASSSEAVNDALIAGLAKYFQVKVLGPPRYVIGMHVQRLGPNHLTLSQELYIRKIAAKYKLGTRASPHTPAIKDHIISNDLGDPSTVSVARTERYRSLLGALLYCTLTRPDISVALGDLAKIKAPTAAHEKALRRVGNYIVGTIDLKIEFKPRNVRKGRELEGFADASFDTCPETSRSRSGIFVDFAGCPILWKAIYQPFVALSSAEAEYAAVNLVTKEVVWLRRILSDIGFTQQGPTNLYCDNNAAITLSDNHISTRPKTKHIRRRYHYIREQRDDDIVVLIKIDGTNHPADFFTKVLGKRLFIKWRNRFLC